MPEYRFVKNPATGTLEPCINAEHAKIIREAGTVVRELFSMNGVNILDKKYDHNTQALLRDIKRG